MTIDSRSIKSWVITLAGIAGITVISGCGDFWCPQSGCPATTTQSAVFATRTQVFDSQSHPIYTMPRPYQPLYGTGPGSGEFGSTPGESYTVLTLANGTSTQSNLAAGNWEVSYNWLPEPEGCSSPSYPSSAPGVDGDWNIPSARLGYYESNNLQNPIAISYPGSSILFKAPVFFCNMEAVDLAGTDNPNTVTNSQPPSNLTVTFNNPDQPNPLVNYSASELSILVYDSTGSPVTTTSSNSTATSISGNTVIFPFPQPSAGGALPIGMYGTVVTGLPERGCPTCNNSDLGGEGYFIIGSPNSNYVQPFGVAAGDLSVVSTNCQPTYTSGPDGVIVGPVICQTSTSETPYPIVTSLSGGNITVNGGSTVAVGTSPVEVVAYGTSSTSTTTTQSNGGSVSIDRSGTGYALVVNNGSKNISIVNLITDSNVATVAVGNSPDAAVVDAANAYAYVVNYADSTATKASLSTYKAVETFSVVPNPTSVSIDGSGNLWVGGNGYIGEYNTSTYAQIQKTQVTGIVNSIAISSGQSKVLTSIVQPISTSNPSPLSQVGSGAIGADVAPAVQVSGSGNPYTASTVVKALPSPFLLGGGTVVSANYGNNLSISATPGGFVVQDVYTGDILASGTTAAPIRAIAVDQTFGYAYMTIPDTNTVITFPMPGSN
jgi:hypothetical protein